MSSSAALSNGKSSYRNSSSWSLSSLAGRSTTPSNETNLLDSFTPVSSRSPTSSIKGNKSGPSIFPKRSLGFGSSRERKGGLDFGCAGDLVLDEREAAKTSASAALLVTPPPRKRLAALVYSPSKSEVPPVEWVERYDSTMRQNPSHAHLPPLSPSRAYSAINHYRTTSGTSSSSMATNGQGALPNGGVPSLCHSRAHSSSSDFSTSTMESSLPPSPSPNSPSLGSGTARGSSISSSSIIYSKSLANSSSPLNSPSLTSNAFFFNMNVGESYLPSTPTSPSSTIPVPGTPHSPYLSRVPLTPRSADRKKQSEEYFGVEPVVDPFTRVRLSRVEEDVTSSSTAAAVAATTGGLVAVTKNSSSKLGMGIQGLDSSTMSAVMGLDVQIEISSSSSFRPIPMMMDGLPRSPSLNVDDEEDFCTFTPLISQLENLQGSGGGGGGVCEHPPSTYSSFPHSQYNKPETFSIRPSFSEPKADDRMTKNSSSLTIPSRPVMDSVYQATASLASMVEAVEEESEMTDTLEELSAFFSSKPVVSSPAVEVYNHQDHRPIMSRGDKNRVEKQSRNSEYGMSSFMLYSNPSSLSLPSPSSKVAKLDNGRSHPQDQSPSASSNRFHHRSVSEGDYPLNAYKVVTPGGKTDLMHAVQDHRRKLSRTDMRNGQEWAISGAPVLVERRVQYNWI